MCRTSNLRRLSKQKNNSKCLSKCFLRLCVAYSWIAIPVRINKSCKLYAALPSQATQENFEKKNTNDAVNLRFDPNFLHASKTEVTLTGGMILVRYKVK